MNQDDGHHQQASALLQRFGKERRLLVTTDWILAKTGNGLARTRARLQFVAFADTVLHSANSRLIRIDGACFQKALEMYRQFDDKMWGMVDCASSVVMRQENLRDALTADTHFKQAGFRCLLR